MKPRFFALLFVVATVLAPSAESSGAYRRVLVWLEGAPLAEWHAASLPPLPGFFRPLEGSSRELAAQREALRTVRSEALRRLEALGFVLDHETDVVLHGLMGRMPEANIAAGNGVHGVRLLREARVYQLLLDAAVPLVRADVAWPLVGGESEAGRGLKIGIIDTGIDHTHPMFFDPTLSFPQGFPRGDIAFTNSKVIVARNYVAMLGDPREAPDSMDHYGHGTFVAAIAAGRRAFGPLAEVAGIAPGAQLGSYRVIGGPTNLGETTDAVIIAAFNDAVADGMNVINMSLGAFPFDLPSEEPVSQAVAAAARAGVVVVAAAGNFAFPVSVSEPASSPDAIGVGASHNSRIFALPLRLVSAATVPERVRSLAVVAGESTAANPALPATDIVRIADNACSALPATSEAKGRIALIQEDVRCWEFDQADNLEAAGAVAAVLYRLDNGDPESLFTGSPLPFYQMSRDDGQALAAFLQTLPTGQYVQARVDAEITKFAIVPDRIAVFSALGPANNVELKPDLVAPGTPVYSALQVNDALGFLYGLERFGLSDGTSFSAPMVAGAAALVRQRHPSWTSAQVRSAVVNTATAKVTESGQTAPILASGAGRLDVSRAVGATAVFDPVTLSLGSTLLTEAKSLTRQLRITNVGQAVETFQVEVAVRTEIPGGSVKVEPALVGPLQPGASASVQVAFQTPASAPSRASVDGHLRIRANGSGLEYVVPYWAQVVNPSGIDWMYRIRGNGQTAPVSTTLPKPLAVQVVDIDGIGVGGATVEFKILEGGGALSADLVVTDFSGVAAVTVRLPDTPGPVAVQASTGTDIVRTFTATARPSPEAPAAGLVNAASFTAGLAPGGIFSLFGTGLAAGTESAKTLPLPRSLASAEVLFNGQAAPLFYVSPLQVNGQAPFELAGAGSVELRVSVAGVLSPPINVAMSDSAPAIFTFSQDGRGTAALHLDFGPVNAASPARPGEVLVLFATGLGAVTPATASGEAGPSSPLATTVQTPVVKIGTSEATVLFSGLAPGFAGLYQVNFQVPDAAPPGDAVPLQLAVGAASSNAVTMAVR